MILFGAELSQLEALAGEAKSYAERLFDYPSAGALDRVTAAQSIVRVWALVKQSGTPTQPFKKRMGTEALG